MAPARCAPTSGSAPWNGAFRSLKTVDLKVRPIYHRTEPRVRAHVFLCMLAYYVEWHMRQKLKPMLFDDEDAQGAEARRPSVVAPAKVSMSARVKAAAKRTSDGDPVHSLRTLIDDLATITRNTVAPRIPGRRTLPGHHTAHCASEEGPGITSAYVCNVPSSDILDFFERQCIQCLTPEHGWNFGSTHGNIVPPQTVQTRLPFRLWSPSPDLCRTTPSAPPWYRHRTHKNTSRPCVPGACVSHPNDTTIETGRNRPQ